MKPFKISAIIFAGLFNSGVLLGANVDVEFAEVSGPKYVLRNTNDDYDNGEWDKDDNETDSQGRVGTLGENDLVQFKVTTTASDGTLNLVIDPGSVGKIEIWAGAERKIPHAKTWMVSGELIPTWTRV